MFTRTTTNCVLSLLLFSAAAFGSDTVADKRRAKYDLGSTWNDTYRIAARIQPHKGIGEFEALALASAYFGTHINLCGGPKLPKDRGDRWVADTMVGYGGAPGPKIIVQKKTGVTYSPGRPKVKDPKEYLKSIRNI